MNFAGVWHPAVVTAYTPPGQATPWRVGVEFESGDAGELLLDDDIDRVRMRPQSAQSSHAAPASAIQPGSEREGTLFSLAELQVPAAELPAGVDPHERQNFLQDVEFAEVFGMDKAAFGGLPKWQQKRLKKPHKLF